MHPEPAKVIFESFNEITVERERDKQFVNFIKQYDVWLLKNNATFNSMLFGTQFVLAS